MRMTMVMMMSHRLQKRVYLRQHNERTGGRQPADSSFKERKRKEHKHTLTANRHPHNKHNMRSLSLSSSFFLSFHMKKIKKKERKKKNHHFVKKGCKDNSRQTQQKQNSLWNPFSCSLVKIKQPFTNRTDETNNTWSTDERGRKNKTNAAQRRKRQ